MKMVKVYWNIIIDHILNVEFLIIELAWLIYQILKQCQPFLWN
jgi:hypothetical protein